MRKYRALVRGARFPRSSSTFFWRLRKRGRSHLQYISPFVPLQSAGSGRSRVNINISVSRTIHARTRRAITNRRRKEARRRFWIRSAGGYSGRAASRIAARMADDDIFDVGQKAADARINHTNRESLGTDSCLCRRFTRRCGLPVISRAVCRETCREEHPLSSPPSPSSPSPACQPARLLVPAYLAGSTRGNLGHGKVRVVKRHPESRREIFLRARKNVSLDRSCRVIKSASVRAVFSSSLARGHSRGRRRRCW